MAYTDLLNEGIDDLATKLATATSLRVVTDPRNIAPPCIFLDAPDVEAFNYNIAKMTFPARIISLGPANLDAMRNLLAMCANIMAAKVGLTAARPSGVTLGGVDYAAYDLTIAIQVQTA